LEKPQNFHSAEMRWFLTGELSAQTLQWFLAGVPAGTVAELKERGHLEEKRADNYLVLSSSGSVGVKMRGGTKFEIKAQVGASGPLVAGSVTGRCDQWVKWSFAHPGLEIVYPEMQRQGKWVEVIKERFSRKFSGDSGTIQEVDPARKPWPQTGCNVELTRLQIGRGEGRWHSLGFEAFGPEAGNKERLIQTLQIFFSGKGAFPEVKINLLNSASYPAWLMGISA
jgi:hypothetical protein